MKRLLSFLSIFVFLFFSCDVEETTLSESTETNTASPVSTSVPTQTTTTTDDSSTSSSTDTSSDNSSSSTTTDTSSNSTTSSNNVSNRIYQISGTSCSFEEENITGKTAYLVKINDTSSSISSQYIVSSASGISLEKSGSSYSRGIDDAEDSDEYGTSFDSNQNTNSCHFIESLKKLPSVPGITTEEDSSRAVGTSVEVDYSEGDTRYLYLATSSGYEYKQATLKTKTDSVYVWVVDDYAKPYIDGSKRSSVTDSMAEDLGQKMESMYKYICNVYTELPSKILYVTSSSTTKKDMESLSSTGKKINIVITDCYADNSRSSTSGGVVGFTSLVDLYSFENGAGYSQYKSNVGNYFYVDSYWVVQYFDECIATLAHEFQHLLSFGVKYIENDVEELLDETAYNEMLSMLCEDMMQDYLELSNDNVAIARLPLFNRYYFNTGVAEYDSDSTLNTATSYANCYAFGAWLVRQFGGADLVHIMANDLYAGLTSIVNAVNSKNGTNYSISDLLLLYSQALIFDDTSFGFPTFNQDAVSAISYNGYSYPIKAVDLWNLDDILDEDSYSSNYYKFDGPYYFTYNYSVTAAPYSFTIHKLGTITSDSISLNLSTSSSYSSLIPGHKSSSSSGSSSSASKLKYYIMIK